MAEWIGMALLASGGLGLWAWVWSVNKRGREDRLTLERVRVEVDSLRGRQREEKGVRDSFVRLERKFSALSAEAVSHKDWIKGLDEGMKEHRNYIAESNHEFEDLQKRVRALEEKMPKPASPAPKKGKRR